MYRNAYRYKRRINIGLIFISLILLAIVLAFCAPFFPWGENTHTEQNKRLDRLEEIVQIDLPSFVAKKFVVTPTSLSAYINAKGYYIDEQPLNIEHIVDAQYKIQGICTNNTFIEKIYENGTIQCRPETVDMSIEYQGTWDANSNTPTLTSGIGLKGQYYVVSVSGTTMVDLVSSWTVGDWIIFNGVAWEKADHTDAVSSVAGKTGVVTLGAADIVSGTFSDARISQSSVTQHQAAINHQSVSGAGANTHAQIDSHISDSTLHRTINDAGSTITDLWSASKISTSLSGKAATAHTHAAIDVIDFNSAADARISIQKGVANGLATLDMSGKIPASQLDLDSVDYQGTWNASANSPTLTSGVGTKGHYYVVSFAGTTILNTVSSWEIGDWAIFNGVAWQKADHSDAVSSVAGKMGAVTLDATDIASGQFADARISQTSVLQHQGSINHQSISGAGTNTHAQIDTHVGDATKHRIINDAGTSNTELWSAFKIDTEVSGKASTVHVHATSDITTGTFANARISQSSVTQHQAAINHQSVSGAGTNTHAQIDTHIGDATKHRLINDTGMSVSELWSASKIASELAGKSGAAHTHTSADITNFNSAADARISAQKGAANGLATLGPSGKIPASQLDLDSVSYQGSWNANTNTPTLTSSVGTKGHYYVVSVSGSTVLDGISSWTVGDWVIFNGVSWEKADHSDAVSSVAGKTGAVTLAAADIASGTFANARISQSSVTQHQAAINHQSISGAGTNTHAQIDSHISDATLHRTINDAGATTTDLWSASKITSQLAGKASSSHTHAASDITSGTFANARISQASVTQHQAALSITGTQISSNPVLSGYIQLADITAPANPGASKGRLYKKSGNDGLFWKPDAAGSEVDLTLGGGAGTSVDAQQAAVTSVTSTLSTSWVDLAGMTLTTSNTAPTTYQVSFSCRFQSNGFDRTGSVILNVDGVDDLTTERAYTLDFDFRSYTFGINCLLFNIPNGKIIKVRYKTTGNTLLCYQRALTIYGQY